ncbi:3-deoxy-7-phosphoheptulonate synthase [Streptoalloteichus hindustanus]|uniref:3-deoxy-7-phosphoheptulonate synthase n=1 Tax=Streptoalloteichus hindustanus TaxID=2017 RepID=UPI0009365829|nr:3-deoxy-7-phosphoheptulonate synthase [Streptoalloteichus hindustanus]
MDQGPPAVGAGGTTVAERLPAPTSLAELLPVTDTAAATVLAGREAVRQVLDGVDERLLVFVGPCSVHDVDSALAYAKVLRGAADELADDLVVVMRTYFEKPRTVLGWPGLLVDPGLDGGYAVEDGLRRARALLVEISELGLPTACEWLSPISPGYLGDLVSWAAIGARTVESQVHRQLASGLPMPVGMKNGTSGSVQVAVDAVRSAAASHAYLGVEDGGAVAVLRTSGNEHCHVVLRGGADGPNYGAEHVHDVVRRLRAAGLPERLVVDASHGNSGKCHERQRVVAEELAEQIAEGQLAIRGVALESFLEPGRQDIAPGRALTFGQSVTDACMGWDVSVDVLRTLAEAARARRHSADLVPARV